MNLTKNEKKYITRYLRLNQPCFLSDITQELCFNEIGPKIKIDELYRYLFWANNKNEIIFNPPIFEKAQNDLLKGYTIRDLILKHIDCCILIPNYIVKVWKNWCIKKINSEIYLIS